MTPWQGIADASVPLPNRLGWLRFVLRLLLVALTIFSLMIPMFMARALGMKVMSEAVVRLACQMCLRIIGIELHIEGAPMPHAGAVVANHASWLDIFTLNAVQRAYFVSKAEVQKWPLVGLIARSAGTVFIARRASDAKRQKQVFLDRINQGDKLLFFPEGTSTDGRRVLKFRSSLFAAFFEDGLRERMWIQPVTVNYNAPKGQDAAFYGWWGGMEFAPHFAFVLAARHHGSVVIHFADPIRVSDVENRKVLADMCETAVRAGLRL